MTLLNGYYSNPFILIQMQDSDMNHYIQIKQIKGQRQIDITQIDTYVTAFDVKLTSDNMMIYAT